MDRLEATLQKREALLQRLLKAMEHIDRVRLVSILTSQLSLDELQHLVEFQER